MPTSFTSVGDPEPLAPQNGHRESRVPALERALSVLEHLAEARRGCSISELSRRLELPKSSVHLIVRTLERRGYLHRCVTTGRYRFGVRLVGLGRAALAGLELRDLAHAPLEELARKTGLVAVVGVLDRGEAVVIDRVDGASPGLPPITVGRRLDLHTTSIGKALLASLPDAEIESRVRAAGLPRHNERSISTAARLYEEITRVRARGWALADEEDLVGVRCVGAPIVAPGQPLSAAAVVGTISQVPRDKVADLAEAVQATAAEIAQKLGS